MTNMNMLRKPLTIYAYHKCQRCLKQVHPSILKVSQDRIKLPQSR